MIFGPKFRLTWDESVQNFRDNIGWQLIAFLVAAGTIIVFYLIVLLSEYCLTPKTRQRIRLHRERYVRSYGRVFVLGVALLVLGAGLWTAATMYGIPLFSVLLTYGIVTGVLTYMFGFQLQCIGAYLNMTLAPAKVAEGQNIKVSGIGGTVTAIGYTYTELRRANENGTMSIFQIPNTELVQRPVEIDYHEIKK